MKNHFFENKKLKSILTTWLDQEYLETSNFPLLKEIFKKRIFIYFVTIRAWKEERVIH